MGRSQHSVSSHAGHMTTETVFGEMLALRLGNGDEHRVADNFLLQKVEKETRGFAILNWILTNKDDLVGKMAKRGTLGESDHVLLEFLISKETKA